MAVFWKKSLPLTLWLLHEKGADVHATDSNGFTPLHIAKTPDIVTALINCDGDLTLLYRCDRSPLMQQALSGTTDSMARLLEHPRVRATINMQDRCGRTALHWACICNNSRATAASKVHLLLQAGGNPTIPYANGLTSLGCLRQELPFRHATIALLEQALADAEKTSLLVKARRLAVAANSNTVAPSHLQGRMVQGEPLPHVALVLLMDGQEEEGEGGEEGVGEEGSKLRTTLAFMCGLGREAMPWDVFRVVMDLLMPLWDPLRRKSAGAGKPLPQG